MRRIVFLWFAVLALGLFQDSSAQTTGPPIIHEIEVVGALTVGSRQVLAWSGLEAGAPFSRETVSLAIRNLFETQKFSNVFIYQQDIPEGVKLIVNLQEFPRIRTIRFEGHKKVKEKDLREAFPLHVGQFANPAVTRRELKPLRAVYYEKGYFNVAIHTDSTVVDANNMEDLVITIIEGRKVKVQTISFVGNTQIDGGDLRGSMKQGTKGFLRSGTFKKAQFEEDRERIVTYCRNEGYLDAAVTDVEMNFREDREKLDLVIHVDEGPRYYIGDIHWQGNTVFDDLVIADQIWLEKGNVFKEDEYLETLSNLQQMYADRGYIYITVEPQRDIVDQTVNVDFTFIEGQPAKIHDIMISGNHHEGHLPDRVFRGRPARYPSGSQRGRGYDSQGQGETDRSVHVRHGLQR